MQIKLGVVDAPNTQSLLKFDEVYAELGRRSRLSLVSAPPIEGVGTIRSHQHGPEYEDDGGISSDEGDGDEDEEPNLSPLSHVYDPPRSHSLAPIVQPEPRRLAIASLPSSLIPASALRDPIATKPGSHRLTSISKILRRPTPSKTPSHDSETTPTVCITSWSIHAHGSFPSAVQQRRHREEKEAPPIVVESEEGCLQFLAGE